MCFVLSRVKWETITRVGFKQGNDLIRFAFLNNHSSCCYLQHVGVGEESREDQVGDVRGLSRREMVLPLLVHIDFKLPAKLRSK